ncbi:hypothetical protein J6590_107795, partial [Homalodisca vitripennis]
PVSLTTHKYCPRILCLSCANNTACVTRRFIRQSINKTTSAVSQCLSQPTNTALVSYVFHVQIRLLVLRGDLLDNQYIRRHLLSASVSHSPQILPS